MPTLHGVVFAILFRTPCCTAEERCDTSLQPLDRDDLAAGRLDPRNGIFRVLDHGRHVMRVGVHDGVGIAYDRDMAFPEDQVAALEMLRFRDAERAAEPVALHVAVAW